MLPPDELAALERAVIGTCLVDPREHQGGRLLARLAAACPPPLHRWIAGRDYRLASLVLDQVLSCAMPHDTGAMLDRLGRIPFAWAMDELAGKARATWEPCAYEASVLAAIGGYGAVTDWPLASGYATTTGAVAVLRGAAQIRQLRASLALCDHALSACDPRSDGHGEAWTILERSAKAILTGGEARDLGAYLGSAIDAAQEAALLRREGRAPSCTWGITELDALVPMRPGGLYVLAAGPGCGKTSLALQASSETADQSGPGAVAVAALEMRGEELATILAGRHLGVSPAAIREGVDGVPWDDLRALAATWSASGALLVRDAEALGERCTADAVVAWLRSRSSSGGLVLGVLDYLGLLDAPSARATEYQTLTAATKALKRAALALRVPLLVLSQLNRDGRKAVRSRQTGEATADPEPTLADLRGSGSIEQDADAVVFLHRECAPGCADATIPMRAIVAKHRAGATGSIPLWFHRRSQRFLPRSVAPEPTASAAAERAGRLRAAPSPTEDLFA